MALFACIKCDVVDESELIPADRQKEGLCTSCLGLPWHGHFPAEKYNPEKDVVSNRSLTEE